MKWLRSHRMRKATALFLCGITMVYLTSCNYYKVVRYGAQDLGRIDSIQAQKKILLHNGVDIYRVRSLKVENGTMISMLLETPARDSVKVAKEIHYPNTGYTKIDTVLEYEPPYLYPIRESERYRPAKERSVLREVHLFLGQPLIELQPGLVEFPAESIWEIRVIENNSGKSVAVSAAIVMGGLLVASIIGMLIAPSLTFHYQWPGWPPE